MKFLISLFALTIFNSCSSIKELRGVPSQTSRQDLKLSAEYVSDFSQENYHFINLYFLNLAEAWLRLKQVRVVTVKNTDNFYVISGNDLEMWLKSMQLDFELKKLNLILPPKEEALEGELTLPGRLQTKRWLLLQTPKKNKLEGLSLEVIFLNSEVKVYDIELKGTSL
mgnify:CR=1 FL=1